MSLTDRTYTFDNFIVGPCNRNAYAACIQVCESPGGSFNPLFLYGETGTGKTHLLRALRARASRSNQRVISISGWEALGGDFLTSIQERLTASDSLTDYLIIDDLQEAVENAGHVKGLLFMLESFARFPHQVIVSSSRAPAMLKGKNVQSLTRRISGGFIMRILPLDDETRRSMIMNEVSGMNLMIKSGVVRFLSHLPLRNYSQVRALLLRLEFEGGGNVPIDEDFSVDLVSRMIKSGELLIPEGYDLPRDLSAGRQRSPYPAYREVRKTASESRPTDQSAPAGETAGIFDTLERKFDDISQEISREMIELRDGQDNPKSSVESEIVLPPDDHDESGLIEEWSQEEERLIEED